MTTGDPSLYLSTVQAAAALGVSVSTVKRWVDEGVLPAHRTAGGHRKLLRSEILALVRRGELPHGDLGALAVMPRPGQAADLDALAVSLQEAMLRGEADRAGAVIRRAYGSGVPLETLADRVIAPALAGVGNDWQCGRIDIWQEHRGTQMCVAALNQMKADLERRAERNRPLALGAAPEGDPYLLPTLLAELVLLDAGWQALNLGPNTPLLSLERAVRELRPRLLWLSVSYLPEPASFVAAYAELYRTAERLGVAVAVGGQALADAVRAAIPYTTHGDGLSHLAAFARTLHPRPRPPRRGRPPRGN